MGEATAIEWTDATWNTQVGCRRVSPGCAHCYADTLVTNRLRRDFRKVTKTSRSVFRAPLRWWPGRRVFANSLSDFFIEEADGWRDEAWEIIRDTPRHTYQILTKRPERIAGHLPSDWGPSGYPNVWLGVSGETVGHATARGRVLAEVPARLRFLSAEPWLEPDPVEPDDQARYGAMVRLFDWVILGGESGRGARPMSLPSARLVRDACTLTVTPLFLKQLGGHPDPRSHEKALLDGAEYKDLPR